MEIKIHKIEDDGLPDMDGGNMTGRVAFLFDGCIVSGWPLDEKDGDVTLWEANSDVGNGSRFYGVTHWVEFSIGLHNIEYGTGR